MSPNSTLPSIFLAGTIGGLLGALGVSLILSEAPPQALGNVQGVGLGPELGDLQLDLRNLVQAMKVRPMPLPASIAPAARTLVVSDNSDVLAALSSLEQAIRQMATPDGLTPRLTIAATPLHTGTPGYRDHPACLATSKEVAKDEELAVARYFGMSMSQVYRLFGPPESTQAVGAALHWTYESPGHDSDKDYDLTVVFHGGLVINLWA
ncbi:MAG: hypothetical protein ACJAZ8_000475 [Planctomycetota bacterium]|jgi:hypothetical protein